MALIISTWLWGHKYSRVDADRLKQAVNTNLSEPHRFLVFNDEDSNLPSECFPLMAMPGCFARLRVFEPSWLVKYGIHEGDVLVTLDLDLLITGSLDGLFNRDEPFTILQNVNTANPCPYNGSIWMLQIGHRPDVWTEFSLDAYHGLHVPYYEFPDDQGWLAFKLPNASAFGPRDGIYAFKKRGWPKGDALPSNARIVAFPGHRQPNQFRHIDWIRQRL